MKVEELIPQPLDRVQFNWGLYKLVPKATGCYVITTFNNDILYIGLTENFFERFQQHLSNHKKTNPTKEGKGVWFFYTIYNSQNLPQLERTWINQFVAFHGQLPILNKLNSPLS
jgi:hypothetical protein